jgi:type I restriction enzyme S subunit
MIYVESNEWIIIKEILGKYIDRFDAFGSRVKGGYKPLSDLDLVYDDNISDNEIARILNEFDDSMLPFKIDIVNSAHCSTEFKALIDADRRPLDS